MQTIEIICTAYDGYARFIPQLMLSVENQTVKPDKVTIVLGRDHGLKDEKGLNLIYTEEHNIGRLLNIGLRQSKADYVLAPDIDDLMLPNAIEDILQVKKDVVLCDYYVKKKGVVEKQESYNPENSGFFGGKPGYYAFKRGIAEYEDHDYRDIPMLLNLKSKGATFGKAERPAFFYLQRTDGHAVKYINKRDVVVKHLKEAYEKYR